MERGWSGNAKRLSQLDKAEIERLIRGGETFETVATEVGCSVKSIQRYLALTGGLNVLDTAFASVFPKGLLAGVIGRDGVYLAGRDNLAPDGLRQAVLDPARRRA